MSADELYKARKGLCRVNYGRAKQISWVYSQLSLAYGL